MLSSEEKQKWVTKMLGYDFEIIYKKGNKNGVVVALSRKDEDVEALLYAILIIQPDWIAEANDEWKNDEKIWIFIQKLQQDPSSSITFRWKDEILWYKDLLYIGKSFHLDKKVNFKFHSSPIGWNSGFLKNYHSVKEYFWGIVLKLMFKNL